MVHSPSGRVEGEVRTFGEGLDDSISPLCESVRAAEQGEESRPNALENASPNSLGMRSFKFDMHRRPILRIGMFDVDLGMRSSNIVLHNRECVHKRTYACLLFFHN